MTSVEHVDQWQSRNATLFLPGFAVAAETAAGHDETMQCCVDTDVWVQAGFKPVWTTTGWSTRSKQGLYIGTWGECGLSVECGIHGRQSATDCYAS